MTDYVKMPIVDLDDVGEYINSPKQKKLMNRLYHLEEFNKMLTEIIDNYIEQVVHMTDDELVIDRSNFIKTLFFTLPLFLDKLEKNTSLSYTSTAPNLYLSAPASLATLLTPFASVPSISIRTLNPIHSLAIFIFLILYCVYNII